ncbi:MAG: DUF805 domain-containing protein, partial [Sphingomonadales bacterium]|nr:DUF805 domain-containing protein [Sphingomonadales bacterium]
MEWMLMPLRRYADFSGRSRHKEYWMFALLLMAVGVTLTIVTGGFSSMMDPTSMVGNATMGAGSIILGLFYL